MAKKEKLCTFLESIEEDRYGDDEEMEEAVFSRRHYQAIADILNDYYEKKSAEMIEAMAKDLADLFEADNPRFDRRRFYSAVGVKQVYHEEEPEEDEEEPEENEGDEEEKDVEKEGAEDEEGEDEESEEEPEEETEEEPEEDEEEVDEAVAELGGVDKVLKALGSDPVSGLGDLLGALGTVLEKAKGKLSGSQQKKVETALERMKREAQERGNPLAAGDDVEPEDDEEEMDEDELNDLVMNEVEKWIQKAIKPSKKGALRKQLGAKEGEPIAAGKLEAAAKKGGKLGKRARLALTLRSLD